MQRKSNRVKNKRINKINRSQKRNIIIVVALIICLCVIYSINFLTKSEETVQMTNVKFMETTTGNILMQDVELHQDEEGNYYVILPEKVQGIYAQKFFTADEMQKVEEYENKEDKNSNTQVQINNGNMNQVQENTLPKENVESNQNTIIDGNTVKSETQENTSQTNEKQETTKQSQSSLFDKAVKANSEHRNTSQVLEELEEEQQNSDKPIEDNKSEVGNSDNKTDNENIENGNNQNTVKPEDNENKNEISSNSVENQGETQETNTVTNQPPKDTSNEVEENGKPDENDGLVLKEDNILADERPGYLPGEKIYLDKEIADKDLLELEVKYQTVEIEGLKLYKQEILANDDQVEIKVTGYIPLGYGLNITPEDLNKISELKSDVEDLEGAEVLLAYDIKIMNDEQEYQPKQYFQNVEVEINSRSKLAGRIKTVPVEVVHITQDDVAKEILFSRISLAEKREDAVEFVTDEFSTYAIFAYSSIEPDRVNIYDYDSDYNYYIGKNYTDNNAGTNQNLYNDNNLAEVTINYYGYDYTKNINDTRTFNIIPNWSVGMADEEWNNVSYPVTITANTANNEFIDSTKSWEMSFVMPQAAANEFLLNNTQNSNDVNMRYDATARQMILSGNNWNDWDRVSATQYRLNLTLVFSDIVSIGNVNNLVLTASESTLVGYVSAYENERQSLFTYVKCMPIINGNISFELIDNPYMDRPAGFGFDGWTTHEQGYNFSINNDNKVQTLTVNTNGSKEITINLYANWRSAKVVFINPSATNGSGLSPNRPVNSWNNANTALETAVQAQNASNRELNIIVLVNGALENLNALGNKAYTLTSLYAGTDYRNNNTYLNLSNNFTLSNDLQLDFLNVRGSANYTSTETTSTISRQINGSARNLRIGRGMMPLNLTNTTTTFGQVLGGGNAERSYKLVIESGKYANIQTASTSSTNQTIYANMTLGCDYDRVTETNNNLYVYNRTATRSGAGTLSPRVNGKPLFEIIVKSGTFGMDYFNTRRGDFAFSGIYLGGHSSGTDNGDRVMIVEGGNIANLLGGLAIQSDASTVKTHIYVKGGYVQNIVGGAGVSTTRGDRTIQVTDGEVAYSVSGGSNGYTAGESSSANPTGQLVGDTLIYIGGNAIIGTAENNSQLYDVNAGCVLGAGNGNDILPETAGKVDKTHVIVDGNAYISNNIYGGGNFGVVGNRTGGGSGGNKEPVIEFENASNNITSGETYLISNDTRNGGILLSLTNNNGFSTDEQLQNTNFPSANAEWTVQRSGNGYTLRNNGTNRYLSVSNQNSNNIALTTSATPFVFNYSNNILSVTGGRNGRTTYYVGIVREGSWWTGYEDVWKLSTTQDQIYFIKYKKIQEDIKDEEALPTKVTIDIYGGTIGQDIYGGANQNDIYGTVDINIYNGNINGTTYGGSNTRGTVTGATDIDIEGGTLGLPDELKDILFAGGKGQNTTISQHSNIDIVDKTNSVCLYGDIYGGSALGQIIANSYVNVQDIYSENNSILLNGTIYGGGKGDSRIPAQNGKNVTVTVDGGNYASAKVFGGCNINGTISGEVLVKIGENYGTVLDEVYGGGNQATITTDTDSDYVYLYKNATVNNAFNGGNSAGIDGNLSRAIYAQGAKVTNIYGGSNASGNLTETHVNISENAQIGNVFGGGYGQDAIINGNTDVNIESSQVGNSYGGGNAGAINGNTDVDVDGTTITEAVYGGGKSADVSGITIVNVDSSTANEIYGGGEDGQVTNNTNRATGVYIDNTIANNIYGGGKGKTATVRGNANLEITSLNGPSKVNESVYGGGNAGQVEKDTLVTILNANITNSVYGGGNQAGVAGITSVAIEDSNAGNIYGGGNQGEVGETTSVSVISTNLENSVYGGGNQGEVKGNTTVIVSNQNTPEGAQIPEVKESVFGGGKAANVNGTTVSLIENAKVQNVYGGGDQGEARENTNVYVSDSTIVNEVFGGGKGADVGGNGTSPGSVRQNTVVRIESSTANKVFGGGKGITAFAGKDTNVSLREGAEIASDVYGGGDNGYVTGSSFVELLSPTINGSCYAAGNGARAVVYGNSHVYSEGTTYIGESLYGGGNAAETGNNGDTTALATVDIAGLVIDGNIYGGANSSQINGTTIINIGDEAINEYYGEEKYSRQGKIEIAGTVYGGGQSMNINSDVWDDTAISVTKEIYINIFGDGYDTNENNTLNIGGSIFGSGNASNAAKDGFVSIRNFGTEESRKHLQSIQRSSIARIDNSVLMIAGVKDSTSQYKETPFTFNKIAELKIQNNTTLYLRNGANRVSKLESLNADGTTYATVDINDDYTVNASSDNRIYMANGTNLNICYGDPQKLEVSPVKGMTFFGMYKSAPDGYDDPDQIYKGIYDEDYQVGEQITDWNSREYLRTYVYGEHTRNPEQDVEKDGFYTNYEALDEGYEYGNISSENYSAKSYTAYIYPTPTGEYTYYYWYAGPDQDTYVYDLELVASKFSTMGAVELPFSDMNFPDATLTMSGIDTSGLENNVEFVNKNEIKNIDLDNANSKFGLSMKTGNTGWSMSGSTNFYNGGYDGDSKYQFENAQTTPSFSFFLHHSNNITEDRNLGRYTITMNLTYWRDSLNRGTALVIINITMFTRVYEGVGYNTAITPGMQYDLFSGTLTNITTKSSFSTYFEMGELGFFTSLEKAISDTGLTVPEDYYDNSYRVISSGTYVFPENTTITMIDRYDKNNPTYYYYTVSRDDEQDGKTLFKLNEFLVMGSTDEYYNEANMRDKYYNKNIDYQYENFIFIVNFEGANFDAYADNSRITPEKTYFEMFLRLDLEQNGEKATIDLAKIINDQYETTNYGIYKTASTIGIEASLSRNKIYLGNDVFLNVRTTYNASNSDATIFDTRYFDKKLGVKLTFYYKGDSGKFVEVGGGSILGTEFALNGSSYYPRADGTTRIKIAELVSNSSSAITMKTENSTLPTGEYKIKVESFGSADGIYFGEEVSASDIIDMEIVNDIYGLKSSLEQDKQAIVDSKTGRTLDDEGYISESAEDNKLNFNLEYQSGLSTPYITVSLYRRNYDNQDVENPNVYDTSYTLVDLKDYVTNELVVPQEILSGYDETNKEEVDFINGLKKFDKEYEAVNTETIKNTVVDNLVSVNFDNLDYELKQGLKTGTYRLVFKLYDANDITAGREIKDEEGNIIQTVNYNVREYQEIGDSFSYIIIK